LASWKLNGVPVGAPRRGAITMTVKPIPDGYHTITPYLTVTDAAAQIEFLQKAFGAEKRYSHSDPDGSIRHAEVKVGDSMVMIGQARDQWKPRPSDFYLYVENVDDWYKRAVLAGGKSLGEPTNQAYGDRSAGVEDSNGNHWWIATHVEDVSAEEMERRMKEKEAVAK
jgi:PhnB protein